ncbi:ABC transporter permease subunit [Hymenobacter coalescens]
MNCWLPTPSAKIALPLDHLVQGSAAVLGVVPRLVLVLALAAVHPPSSTWLRLVLVLTCWSTTARLTRALVLRLSILPYVEAGYAAGFSHRRLLLRHILPNAWNSLRATLPLNLSLCLSLQTTLSFLGIGLTPDQAEWGRTLANARLEPTAWWLVVGSLCFLTLTTSSIHVILPSKGPLSKTGG